MYSVTSARTILFCPDSCTTCFQPCLGAGHYVGAIVPRVFHTGLQLMEALSKASGAETAAGVGDKRRAGGPMAGSCYGRPPSSGGAQRKEVGRRLGALGEMFK